MSPSALPSPADLAASIAGPARYKFDELVEGVALEQHRLAARAYAVVLWQQVFDYDGLTDWLFLREAFDELAEARSFADSWLASVQHDIETTPRRASQQAWREDATRSGRFVPGVSAHSSLRVEAERLIALTGGPYDRVYLRARVLGRFPALIVGRELFDALADSRHELWSYFVDVGEAQRSGRGRRSPASVIAG